MELRAILRNGGHSRNISMNVPMFFNPLSPTPMVDSRWARPYVFRDIWTYPLTTPSVVQNDFSRLVYFVNQSGFSNTMDRYLEGLLNIVDEHIARCSRIIFCDLLMYVDCLAYLCYASDFMTEEQILENYASWAKFVVDLRKVNIKSSTTWGITSYDGSSNEEHLNSCF